MRRGDALYAAACGSRAGVLAVANLSRTEGAGAVVFGTGRDGNFLFGTDNGIHRYDGTSWRVIPFDEGIVGTRINTLYVAQDGRVYVGSDQGISRFENGT